MNNCATGTSHELIFCAEASQRGWKIYMPMGHAQTIDVMIAKPQAKPISIQIKTATYDKHLDRYGVMTSRGTSKSCYEVGDFDILAAWIPDLKEFVFWRFDEIAERKKISYTPRIHRQPGNWDLLDDLGVV